MNAILVLFSHNKLWSKPWFVTDGAAQLMLRIIDHWKGPYRGTRYQPTMVDHEVSWFISQVFRWFFLWWPAFPAKVVVGLNRWLTQWLKGTPTSAPPQNTTWFKDIWGCYTIIDSIDELCDFRDVACHFSWSDSSAPILSFCLFWCHGLLPAPSNCEKQATCQNFTIDIWTMGWHSHAYCSNCSIPRIITTIIIVINIIANIIRSCHNILYMSMYVMFQGSCLFVLQIHS